MKPADLALSPNRLLAGLAAEELARLAPHLQRVEMPTRMSIERRNIRFEDVYFIESGFVSVVASTSRDRRIEVAIIGLEGVTGVSALLADARSANESFMQVAGEGLRISVGALRECCDLDPDLRARLLAYTHALMIQMSQSALAHGRAFVEERLARWLVMAHDRVRGDDIALTHEFLSTMLGARRASVTTAIHALEGEGLIRASRGIILVQDRAALETYADGLYGIAEAEYERLLH